MKKEDIILSLRRFKDTSGQKYHIRRIGIFGSAAKDSMRDLSDIDVVVELGKQDLFDLIGIKLELEDQLKKPVDIVSYRNKMNAFLRSRIDKEAIYV